MGHFAAKQSRARTPAGALPAWPNRVAAHALRKCARAIAAIGMPGNESTIKRIAKEYFHLDIKLSEKTRRTLIRKIQSVSDKLEKAPIECGTCQDEGCNSGFVAYAFGRGLLVLCPPFFMGA